ncbi:MAG: S8 family serine peptidase, partial [Candidatus Thorarchaeota archaeon]|nr:S8 family serine peptidase [Candidatus Thorarchaeota archaeon]
MYKRMLLIFLILSTLQVPIGSIAASSISANLVEATSTVTVESMLNLELAKHRTAFSLADDTGVSAILQFEDELTPAEISFAETLGVNFKKRGNNVVHVGSFYAASVSDHASLQDLSSLGLAHASSGSKQFYPALPSSVPSINAPDVWNNLELDNQAIDGTGTRVAIIDTGAAWLHPSLWRSSTDELTILQSGLDYYVDLDGDAVIDSNEGPINSVEGQTGSSFDYASDYMFIDIDDNGLFEYGEGDRWLGGVDADTDGYISLTTENVVLLGESKVAVFYDQHSSNVYIRGVNLTDAIAVGDTNGHGTHVASTVAGGQPGMTSYVGVAPGADLIIIRSPLDSSSVIDGVAFAIENDADVINMSFSSYLGFLDGTDPEDMIITEAMLKNGTISTLAAGNLGGRPKHAYFEVPSSGDGSATLSVINPPDYSFLSLLWRSTDDDEHVVLSPPGGEDIDLGSFNDITGAPQHIETDNISAYVFPDTSDKGMNRLIVQVSDESHYWDRGSWRVSVTNPSGEDISVDAYAWDNSWTGSAMRFTSSIDYTRTISSPGTADLGVTVASYNEVTEQISDS